MSKISRVLLAVVLSILLIPKQAHANEDYTIWTQSPADYHLTDDVRKITFSAAVDPTSLKAINEETPITLQDVTNPKDPKKLVVDLSINPENNQQVYVSLAKGYTYTDGHSYSLRISKNVKPANSQTTLQSGIQYDFKMINKQSETVAFAKSFEVKNTTNSSKTVQITKNASYIIYDQYASIKKQDILTSSTTLYLSANETAIVSYMDNSAAIVEQAGITVKTSNVHAYNISKLSKNKSLEVTNNDSHDSLRFYVGNMQDTAYYSAAVTEKDNKLAKTIFNKQTINTAEPVYLTKEGKAIVTNEDTVALYVYTPSTTNAYTTTNISEEKAVIPYTLQPGEIVQAKAIDPYETTILGLRDDSAKGKFSQAIYKDNKVVEQRFNKAVYEHGDDNIHVSSGAEAIIKNTGTTTLTLFGATNFVEFNASTEEPIITYELEPGQIASITTTEVEYSTVNLRDPSNKGFFSKVSYKDNRVIDQKFNEPVYQYGDDNIPVKVDSEVIVKNAGNTTQILFAASRFVKFNASTEEPIITYELEPGQIANITTTEVEYSTVNLRDPSNKGFFSKVSYKDNSVIDQKFNEPVYQYGDDNIPVKVDSEVIVKNAGNTTQTLFAASRFVTFNASTEEPIVFFTLAPNESINVQTTEAVNSKIYLRDQTNKGFFSYTLYNKAGLVDSKTNIPVYRYGDDVIYVYTNGYTNITNTGTTTHTLFGAQRYITYTQ